MAAQSSSPLAIVLASSNHNPIYCEETPRRSIALSPPYEPRMLWSDFPPGCQVLLKYHIGQRFVPELDHIRQTRSGRRPCGSP